MAVKKDPVSDKKSKSIEGFRTLAEAFYEASSISFSLVFFPVVILLVGVWLDKRFDTAPLFIIIGIITGVVISIYQATKIRMPAGLKKVKKNNE